MDCLVNWSKVTWISIECIARCMMSFAKRDLLLLIMIMRCPFSIVCHPDSECAVSLHLNYQQIVREEGVGTL